MPLRLYDYTGPEADHIIPLALWGAFKLSLDTRELFMKKFITDYVLAFISL